MCLINLKLQLSSIAERLGASKEGRAS